MNIIFFGGSKFSQYYLDALRKSGLGTVTAFNTLPTPDAIKKLSPDIGIIAYFGYIVPEEILSIPHYGFLNVHYSILPRWRGPAPVQYALLAGDREIGVTILEAAKKVDSGKILTIEKIPILPYDTYLSLEEKLISLGSKMLVDILPKYVTGKAKLNEQNENEVTYSKKIKKEDGHIHWSKSATYIERLTRAYSPWPGAYTYNDAGVLLKIKKAEVIDATHKIEIGSVFDADGYPAVVCDKGALRLLVVQPEGKRDMSGNDYLRGHSSFIGSLLK